MHNPTPNTTTQKPDMLVIALYKAGVAHQVNMTIYPQYDPLIGTPLSLYRAILMLCIPKQQITSISSMNTTDSVYRYEFTDKTLALSELVAAAIALLYADHLRYAKNQDFLKANITEHGKPAGVIYSFLWMMSHCSTSFQPYTNASNTNSPKHNII